MINFFEDVAQDPTNYTNPAFVLEDRVAGPAPDNPLEFKTNPSFGPPPASIPEEMLTEERQELNAVQAALDTMKAALSSTPSTTAALRDSRDRLGKRIRQQEVKVEALEKKALASGCLGHGAAEELRKKWEKGSGGGQWTEKKAGQEIMFAGVKVDSEVLKRAGFADTVAEELKNLEMDDDE